MWRSSLAAHLGTGWSFTAHANDISVRNDHLARKLEQADHVVTVCRYNVGLLAAAGADPDAIDVVLRRRLPQGEAVPSRARDARRPRRRSPRREEGLRRPGRRGRAPAPDTSAACASRSSATVPSATASPSASPHGGASAACTWSGRGRTPRCWSGCTRRTSVCLPARSAPDGDRDAMPLVLKEAMARGVPVVAAAVAGIPEAVDAEVGRLVPPDDAEALAAALASLLDDEDAADRARSGAGRRRVEDRFSLTQEVGRLRRLFVEWSTQSLEVVRQSAGDRFPAVVPLDVARAADVTRRTRSSSVRSRAHADAMRSGIVGERARSRRRRLPGPRARLRFPTTGRAGGHRLERLEPRARADPQRHDRRSRVPKVGPDVGGRTDQSHARHVGEGPHGRGR